MPSRFRVRGLFRPLVLSVASKLAGAGMTPNQATWIMLACSIVAATLFVLVPPFYLASCLFGVFIFITGVMDGVDGSIARLTNAKTRFGAVLDSSMDRLSDAAIFFAPAIRDMARGDLAGGQWLWMPVLGLVPAWLWCTLMVMGAYMTSYVRARVSLADPTTDTDVGLLGRSERLLALVIGSLAGLPLLAIVILCVLANGTAIYRLVIASNALSEKVEP